MLSAIINNDCREDIAKLCIETESDWRYNLSDT